MSGKGDRNFGSQIRDNIQKNIEKAEAVHRKEFFRRRIDLAKEGIKNYEAGKFAPAVTAFKSYVKILEEWKGVAEGGLSPTYFDKTKDVPELLLISGVFWDLAKLYDRTKSHMKHDEFLHYLDKYVLFSKGMPFESVCGETLRKYVANSKCVHTSEFKNAYRRLVGGGSMCFVVTALADVCEPETLPRLRGWRDETLRASAWGRGFIRAYYLFGPLAARFAVGAPEGLRKIWGKGLDRLASQLSAARSRSGQA